MAGTTEMQAATGLPILHIVDAATRDLTAPGMTGGTIGLMGDGRDARACDCIRTGWQRRAGAA